MNQTDQNELPQCEVSLVKSIQDKMTQLLINKPNLAVEKEQDMLRKYIDMLSTRSEEMMIFIQVMLRVKKELAHAMLDFERARRFNTDLDNAKRRVEWLRERLKNISKMCQNSFFHSREKISNAANLPDDDELYSSKFKTILSNPIPSQETNFMDPCQYEPIAKSVEKLTLGYIQTSVKKVLHASDALADFKPHNADFIKKETSANASSYENSVKDVNKKKRLPHTINKNEEYPAFGSPRNDKLKLNSLITYQHRAMDQLVNRLNHLYSSMDEIPEMKTEAESYDSYSPKEDICKIETYSEGILPYIRETSIVGSQNVKPVSEKSTCGNEGISYSLIQVETESQSNTKKAVFPRSPSVWCNSFPRNSPTLINHAYSPMPPSLPSQKTKRQAIDSPQEEQTSTKVEKSLAMKRVVARAKVIAKIKMRLANQAISEVECIKMTRIESLLGKSGILSDNINIAVDAAKALGQLKCESSFVVTGLKSVIEQDQKKLLVYECAKSLILLGCWHDDAINILTYHLKYSSIKVQADILSAILKSHNAQFIPKSSKALISLSNALLDLLQSLDKEIAFNSALSLGHLCINKEEAKWLLLDSLKNSSYTIKNNALNVLVKQMNCQMNEVIDCILLQLSNAYCWEHRINAVELLSHIDLRRLKSYGLNVIFDILLQLLYNHPNKDFRSKIANILRELGMRKEACVNTLKKLGDKNESVRADAIIALATLEMKGEKELKILLDMFDLDSSMYVRAQVIKAFVDLKWNHPHIMRILEERQKADDFIASKAMSAFSYLSTLNSL